MIAARSHTPRTAPPVRGMALMGGAVNALRRAWRPAVGAATLAVTVTACSSLGSSLGGDATGGSAPASSDGSFTSRVKSFFTGDSGRLASPAAPSTTTGAASPEIECPGVEYRQGAATWAMNGPATESTALSLRYQLSFIQTARECILAGNNLTIKVGIQGRVVVGPAGSAGTINIPVRYALVREGLQPQTLWTKLFMVPVTIPPGDVNLTWVHVQEEMTVPRPSAQDLEAYVVYIGFDPDGAAGVKSKPAAKPKTARGRG
jgi:hypothetical protein